MTVNADEVRMDIKIFSKMTDNHINQAIEISKLQVQSDKIADNAINIATIQFARHLLYIDSFMDYGGVTSASTFGNSQTIADKTSHDPYLEQYQQTLRQFGKSKNKGKVITLD